MIPRFIVFTPGRRRSVTSAKLAAVGTSYPKVFESPMNRTVLGARAAAFFESTSKKP